MPKIYLTNFDQCYVTKNDYTDHNDRQEKRSPLSPETVKSFHKRLNIKRSLIATTARDSSELINKTRF